MVRILRGAEKRAVQEGDGACAFFRKRINLIESSFGIEYFRFRSRLVEFVREAVRTLSVNVLFIAFAHLILIQGIFWIIVDIGAYVVELILTQLDGY